MAARIDHDRERDTFLLDFDYSPELVAALKESTIGRRYVKRRWEIPNVADNVEVILDLFGDCISGPGHGSLLAAIAKQDENLKLSHSMRNINALGQIVDGRPMDGRLYEPQKGAVEFALRNANVIIGDPTGCGKTPIAIEVAKQMDAKTIVICCKANAKLKWQAEIRTWADCNDSLVINGQKKYRKYDGRWLILNHDIMQYHANMVAAADLLILDEAWAFGNTKSKRSQAAKMLVETSGKTLMLSANTKFDHIMNQLQILGALDLIGGFWHWANATGWYLGKTKEIWTKVKEPVTDKDGNAVFRQGKPVFRYRAKHVKVAEWAKVDELDKSALRDFGRAMRSSGVYIRRPKRKLLASLPPSTRDVSMIEIDNRSEYKEAEENISEYYMEHPEQIPAIRNQLIKAMRSQAPKEELRAIILEGMADDDEICTEGNARYALLKRLASKGKIDAVESWIRDFQENEPREPLLVFGWTVDHLHRLAKKFAAPLIAGGITPKKREQHIQSWQHGETRLMFCNHASAGDSINLHAGRYMLIFELHENPELLLEQVEGRVSRVGQTKAQFIYYLLADDTIETYVWSRLLRQMKRIEITRGEA